MATKNNNNKIEEERKHPIFEDCEEMENGKAVQKWMLSLNGIGHFGHHPRADEGAFRCPSSIPVDFFW